jgi:hypothetical protein
LSYANGTRLRLTEPSRHIANTIYNPHHFDAFSMLLVENQPTLVLYVSPAWRRVRVFMTCERFVGAIGDAITDFRKQAFAGGWPAVDKGDAEQHVFQVGLGDLGLQHTSHLV